MIGKRVKEKFVLVITLSNHEIKDIMKVIKSLENREVLFKEIIRKINSQEGGFLNFRRLLMTTGLRLMKSALTPLAKSLLIPLLLSAGLRYSKENYGSGTTALIIWKNEIIFYNEDS